MIARICDKCGGLLTKEEGYSIKYSGHCREYKPLDFCDECFVAFKGWLSGSGLIITEMPFKKL